MKSLLQLIYILTALGANQAFSCAQRTAITGTPLTDELTQEAYNLYAIQSQSDRSSTTNAASSGSWAPLDPHSVQTSESHTELPTQDSPRKASLNNQPLHLKLKPLSAPISCRTSPNLKPHIPKPQSKSAPASTEVSPLNNARRIDSSPRIRPLSLAGTQTENFVHIKLPEMLITVSTQQNASQPARKKTLQRTTSFSQSSSSASSTLVPAQPTEQTESTFILDTMCVRS